MKPFINFPPPEGEEIRAILGVKAMATLRLRSRFHPQILM